MEAMNGFANICMHGCMDVYLPYTCLLNQPSEINSCTEYVKSESRKGMEGYQAQSSTDQVI